MPRVGSHAVRISPSNSDPITSGPVQFIYVVGKHRAFRPHQMQSPPHQTPQRTSQRTPSTTSSKPRPSNKTRLLQRERLHLRVRFSPSAFHLHFHRPHRTIFWLLQFCPMRHCPISNLHARVCACGVGRGEGRKAANGQNAPALSCPCVVEEACTSSSFLSNLSWGT